MTKLKMHTPDLVAGNIEWVAARYPGCITESRNEKGEVVRAVDFDLLRQELSTEIVEGPQERYHLNWPGKREALLAANAPIAKTLRPCREESVDFDTTRNLFIEGDNLDALKLLQETYLNKVKMIYIDPPYNTGKDFIYRDSFAQDEGAYDRAAGHRDGNDSRLVSNPESNGRFHSDWLSMIYPRLKLARNLMAEDGLLFVSIGDDEVASLRRLGDEVFGEQNFVAQLVWNAEGHTDNQYDVKVTHEYILVFAKSHKAEVGCVVDPNTRQESNLWKGFAENSITKNGSGNPPSEVTLPAGFPSVSVSGVLEANDPGGAFFEAVAQTGYITRELTQRFDVSYPIRLNEMKVHDGRLANASRVFSGWANADKLRAFIAGGCKPIDEGDGNTLSFYLSDRGVIYYRRERTKARNVVSVLRGLGTTEQMRSELERLGIPFQYPKPKQLLAYLVRLGCEGGGIVLDFFAGSCTTAHAMMELALDPDQKARRFIMVQLPEPLRPEDAKQKPAHDFCLAHGFPPNIAEIGKERLRRVASAIRDNGEIRAPSVDLGFRVLKVDSSNMKDIYYRPDEATPALLGGQIDNIKGDRTDEDLLFQVLLDWGVDLSLPITKEVIRGKPVFFVDTDALAACFATGIDEAFVKELAVRKPLRVVFRDSSYGSDDVKINAEQIFKQLSPGTEVRTL